MIKKYNQHNFFKHTFCQWQQIELSCIEQRQPSYKSKSGSVYYFDTKGVTRYSNHWGRAANCRWTLMMSDTSKKSQGYYVGYAKWEDFFPNNEHDLLYVILVDFQEKSVDFTHKALAKDPKALCRSAVQTKKRIEKIKEVLQNDQWHKYMYEIDIEKAREYIVNRLLNSNEELSAVKREVMRIFA